jgi:hypothetical protein
MFPPDFHPDTFPQTVDLQPPTMIVNLLDLVLHIRTAKDLERVAAQITQHGAVIDHNTHGIALPCQLALLAVLKFVQLVQARYNARLATGERFMSPQMKSHVARVLTGPAWKHGSCGGDPKGTLQIMFKQTVYAL